MVLVATIISYLLHSCFVFVCFLLSFCMFCNCDAKQMAYNAVMPGAKFRIHGDDADEHDKK